MKYPPLESVSKFTDYDRLDDFQNLQKVPILVFEELSETKKNIAPAAVLGLVMFSLETLLMNYSRICNCHYLPTKY